MASKVHVLIANDRDNDYRLPNSEVFASRIYGFRLLYGCLSISLFALFSCSNQATQSGECQQGQTLCDNNCVLIISDVRNCGSCGQTCPQTQVCSQGACKVTCDQGLKNCSNNCVALDFPCIANAVSGSAGTNIQAMASSGSSANTGTGGSSATISGSSGNGGIATSTDGVSSSNAPNGGYISSGAWRGYAWTFAKGGKITPEKFSSETKFPLCASGSIDADPAYASVAMIGWNVNQANGPNTLTEAVTPTKAGITVNVNNKGSSPLRAQIQGPKGDSDASDRWCVAISGTGGFIPFDKFNTQCWEGGSGAAYARQPIVGAMVLVPGSNASSESFDFCVEKIEESDN
jgi:hypothetical protein